MDILRIMSITALAVAIATCAFAFLMYRRISQRLDGLSLAHLTLSRTLQHMVSASMPGQSGAGLSQAQVSETNSSAIDTDENKNIILSDELGVRRIPVSDDEHSEVDSEQSDDGEEDDSSDGESDTQRSQASTPLLRNLNLMEQEDATLLTLELVPSENEDGLHVSDEQDVARIVEMEEEQSASDEDESGLELDDDDEDEEEEEVGDNDADSKISTSSVPVEQSQDTSNEVETDEIVAFTNPTQNHQHQTDLKLQKVETLRKMALEQNLGDEETLKKMKKPQLMSMLGGQ